MYYARVNVLDHGFVEMVDSMPQLDDPGDGQLDDPGDGLGAGDERVVASARVSYAGEVYGDPERNKKLIRYLLKNRHTTPFEHVRYTFRVKLPIFVARQWIRHRTGSFNEMSMRYKEPSGDFYLPPIERFCGQSTDNKQCSDNNMVFSASVMQASMNRLCQLANKRYQDMVEDGLAREVARLILPLNMYTEWYWTVDLHNLMHFLRLRLHSHAQEEFREYGKAVMDLARTVAPYTFECFEDSWEGRMELEDR